MQPLFNSKLLLSSWAQQQRDKRLAYLPDEKSEHLRYLCDTILSSPLPQKAHQHQQVLRDYNRKTRESWWPELDYLRNVMEMAYDYEYRARLQDPFFKSLQNALEGVFKWATPTLFVRSHRNLQAIKDGPHTFWEETGEWQSRYDSWSEWAILKLTLSTQQYLENCYPMLYTHETGKIPAYNGLAAADWVFPYEDPKRFRDEFEISWKPWEYQGYPGKPTGPAHEQ